MPNVLRNSSLLGMSSCLTWGKRHQLTLTAEMQLCGASRLPKLLLLMIIIQTRWTEISFLEWRAEVGLGLWGTILQVSL
jgi:hypothetical protein